VVLNRSARANARFFMMSVTRDDAAGEVARTGGRATMLVVLRPTALCTSDGRMRRPAAKSRSATKRQSASPVRRPR
jgi:hypothetical protein